MTSLQTLPTVFLLSLVAGLGTGLGGLIAVYSRPDRRTFGFLMGNAAGVMISLSFMGLMNEALALTDAWTAAAGFGAGAFLMLAIDFALPHMRFGEREVPNHGHPGSQPTGAPAHPGRHRRGQLIHQDRAARKLYHTGALLAVGITIHNLPEGIAVGAGYSHTPQFGMFIALAILLHNIPEGIATALPLYHGGLSRGKALLTALLSGLAEPIGAVAAAVFLIPFRQLAPAALAFAGGVMMFITLDELIPTAREYGHQHYTAAGIILGALFVLLLIELFGV